MKVSFQDYLKELNPKKINIFDYLEKIPSKTLQHKILDKILDRLIPFNRGLHLQFHELSETRSVVMSKNVKRRKNHLGGAHACALALLGEYTAGVLLAKNFPFHQFRLILSQLNIEYYKQVQGTVTAIASRPEDIPVISDEGSKVEMRTELQNEHSEIVALCTTQWHIKSWSKVGHIPSN